MSGATRNVQEEKKLDLLGTPSRTPIARLHTPLSVVAVSSVSTGDPYPCRFRLYPRPVLISTQWGSNWGSNRPSYWRCRETRGHDTSKVVLDFVHNGCRVVFGTRYVVGSAG